MEANRIVSYDKEGKFTVGYTFTGPETELTQAKVSEILNQLGFENIFLMEYRKGEGVASIRVHTSGEAEFATPANVKEVKLDG